MANKARVLIINSNIELIYAFEDWLLNEGCITKSVQVYDLKTKRVRLKNILREFNPDVILYDVSIPYEDNWSFFKKISNIEEAKNLRFVITTTNKRALDKMVGPTNTTEILGKPFDLKEMEEAIRKKTNREVEA